MVVELSVCGLKPSGMTLEGSESVLIDLTVLRLARRGYGIAERVLLSMYSKQIGREVKSVQLFVDSDVACLLSYS